MKGNDNVFKAALVEAMQELDPSFPGEFFTPIENTGLRSLARRPDDSTYVVEIDLPGYEKDDLTVLRKNNRITITAQEVTTPNPAFDRPAAKLVFDAELGASLSSVTFAKSVLSIAFEIPTYEDTAAESVAIY